MSSKKIVYIKKVNLSLSRPRRFKREAQRYGSTPS